MVAQSEFLIVPFKSLVDLLKLEPVPLYDDSSFRQLRLIERHVSKFPNNEAGEESCKSILIENHYIDRAFIEDYSNFYATSFKPYDNFCKRLHFFKLKPSQLKKEFKSLFELARNSDSRSPAFKRECENFSKSNYLGFSVIKPLAGTPVGRTVLQHYQDDKDAQFQRKFNCTRKYVAHVSGLELTVCGLLFQQQDIAVSACATTALWSSLSKLKEYESLRTPSPAQITKLATQFFLPFGRPMPQENGLSVHQMCQAVQSLGLSPYLLDVTKVNRSTLKGYLHSAVLSGLAPILIIEQVKFDSKRQPWYPDVWHAVTVSGMKVKKNHVANVVGRQTGNDIDSLAGDLDAIYVNDDNLSPYFRVNIGGSADVHLEFEELDDNGRVKETNYWRPSHILIPMHSKIRLGFKELYELAIAISRRLIASKAAYRTMYALQLTSTVQFTTSIKRSSDYLQQLLVGSYRLSSAGFDQFCEEIGLSRYVGIIRLIDKSCGVIEIVVDTTNIPTNPNYLGIICRATNSGFAADVCKTLSHQLGTRGNPCKIIFDLQAGLSI